MSGWIKLHRKMLENAIFYKPDYYQVWSYILLKVNHDDNEFIWNNEKKIIKKGGGIFSQKQMAKDFGFDISKINRILNYLKNENQIEVKTTNKYTEIQVINWSEYQEVFEIGNQKQTKNKPKTNPAQTNKNDNNEENEKEVFDNARKLYPGTKQGLDTEFERFKKHKDYLKILPVLNEKINYQIKERAEKLRLKIWMPPWKNFSTWINNRCWEEEPALEVKKSSTIPNNETLTLDQSKALFQ
jgi:hypothetical protein